MSCPNFFEDIHRTRFNNTCLYFELPPNVLSAVQICCPNLITIEQGCYSYCNFTTVPEEINLINCVYAEGNKTGITYDVMEDTYPSCYANANQDVEFTWIEDTLATVEPTVSGSARVTSASLTSGSGAGQKTRTSGMGFPISEWGKETSTTSSASEIQRPAQTTIYITPVTQAPSTTANPGIRWTIRSRTMLGLVALVIWSVLI